MTPIEFVQKWEAVVGTERVTERATAQSHFLDLCELLNEPKPHEDDPTGERYGFEVGVKKSSGGDGWADVYRQGCFGWEYKKPKGDLKKALNQLREYAGQLGNPPYLVVSDIATIRIHTNWTNTVSRTYEISLEELLQIGMRQRLKEVLRGTDELKPSETRQDLTQKVAKSFVQLAEELRADHDAPSVAHFVNRLVFCMFAEDTGILPKGLFTRLLGSARQNPGTFERQCGQLFEAMSRKGGFFGADPIEWVNGGLFEDAFTLPLTTGQIDRVRKAAELEWDQIDPGILGTLFERGLDPAKRGQLGAHYTDAASIERIVLPVIIAPLEREWEAVKAEIKAIPVPAATERVKYRNAIERRAKPFRAFRDRLKAVRVLDPACGSGNFLYVALRALRDLELAVVNEGEGLLIPKTILELGPENVLGIELNEYAADLARVSVWIGNLQWSIEHGFGFDKDPVLGTLDGIQQRDALLNEDGTEAEWPAAEFIVGNPPFLGDKKMREGLGDEYVDGVRRAYAGRVPGSADFVTFWFAKAGEALRSGSARRAGLVSTNNIRKGKSNEVLREALIGGRLFGAYSDFPWHDEAGAAVRVSISLFGSEDATVADLPRLDGQPVVGILPDLTAVTDAGEVDLHAARPLAANRGRSFNGICLAGPFDVEDERARVWLTDPNPDGRPNSDVLRPLWNGQDLRGHWNGRWLVDFGTDRGEGDAALYVAPFTWVETHVRPERMKNREAIRVAKWWRAGRPRPEMRSAIQGLDRFLVTIETSRHRWFRWLSAEQAPEHKLVVLAFDDDVTKGILESRWHREWAKSKGNWHSTSNSQVYAAGETFATFPFPETTGAQRTRIADAARTLDTLRERWLNPPEWTRDEVLTFPATVGGPWHRHIPQSDTLAPGTVAEACYVRRVAIPAHAVALKARTLTNLYNERPKWLADAHAALDVAVAEAYGLPPDLSTPAMLAALLDRNLAAST